MEVKMATVAEFLERAHQQGPIDCVLHTHTARHVGDKFLNKRSRRTGQETPWQEVNVRTSIPARINFPIDLASLDEETSNDKTYPRIIVQKGNQAERQLFFMPIGERSFRYETDGRPIDFSQLDEYWNTVKGKYRTSDRPVTVRPCFVNLSNLDAVTIDDIEWTLVHTG